jgi:hypothetical protein
MKRIGLFMLVQVPCGQTIIFRTGLIGDLLKYSAPR